jgi:hypothetical protein
MSFDIAESCLFHINTLSVAVAMTANTFSFTVTVPNTVNDDNFSAT